LLIFLILVHPLIKFSQILIDYCQQSEEQIKYQLMEKITLLRLLSNEEKHMVKRRRINHYLLVVLNKNHLNRSYIGRYNWVVEIF